MTTAADLAHRCEAPTPVSKLAGGNARPHQGAF
jgi:hypothetical protein